MKKPIPNDCLIVKPKEGVSPFTHLTWNSHNCPKTIPKFIYDLNKYRLDIMDDPHSLIPIESKPEPESKEIDLGKEIKDVADAVKDGDLEKAKIEAKDLVEKVKIHGKSKNKKR